LVRRDRWACSDMLDGYSQPPVVSMDLSGVFVPVITPYRVDSGEVDQGGFQRNLRWLLGHPIRGIVVGGSTGEAVLLDEDERSRLIDVARGEIVDGRLLLAGTGSESTRASIRLTRQAADLGVDGVLVQPPSFYRGSMTDQALELHYRAIADASPVPVVIYQVPKRLGSIELTTSLVSRLASHPNIVGIKDSISEPSDQSELCGMDGGRFQVLAGSGSHLVSSLRSGAVGGILGVANIVPGHCAELMSATLDGKEERARLLQELVSSLHQEIVVQTGVAGLKHALKLLGLAGGLPRAPLLAVPEPMRRTILDSLARVGLPVSQSVEGSVPAPIP